jgi:molybdate transport system substrate-binding protein
MNRKKIITFLAGIALTLCAIAGLKLLQPSSAIAQGNVKLTISAGASLKDALTEIAPLYSKAQPSVSVRHNFGSSGELQQQIENGAPVDVFVSAAVKQVDELQKKNLILADTRRNLLSNRLVLIVPANKNFTGDLRNLTDAHIERIAIGDPRSVPAGQYAEEALKKLDVWQAVQSKFVLGSNVRQVLQFVESGNAQAGIVYATDAKTSTKVKVVQVIDAKLHKPIVYPVAVLQRSENPAIAKSYVKFLTGNTAKSIFEKYGFRTL